MQLVMVAIRDAKSDQFGTPYFPQSIGTAIRTFDDEVNWADDKNIMFSHPEDFTLWHLGEYETNDATFNVLPQPKILIAADQVKKGQLHKISVV